MTTLANINHLIELLTERIDSILEERDALHEELVQLSEKLAERDEECERKTQEIHRICETIREEEFKRNREQDSIESKLQGLSDRLIDLVKQTPRR